MNWRDLLKAHLDSSAPVAAPQNPREVLTNLLVDEARADAIARTIGQWVEASVATPEAVDAAFAEINDFVGGHLGQTKH